MALSRERRIRRGLPLAALCAALALLAALFGAQERAGASVPPPPSGWTTVWTDDFTGAAGTLPSSAEWIVDTGHAYPGGPANWGTGEIQSYTNSTANLSQDGSGNLRITPLRDSSGNWTSARIESRDTFQPAAGGTMRIEGRIQMPNVTGNAALGYWAAFWTLGDTYRGNYQNWPGIGEFDIMENVNGLNTVWGTLHCGTNPGGSCNETNGLGSSRACPGSSCQAAFHTYTFEWDRSVSPETLRWYVDGVQYHSVNAGQMDATTWANATHHAHFLLLNVAMGGGFPNGVSGVGTPTSATDPGHPMLVDYVTVLTSGGSGGGDGGDGGSAYATLQAENYTEQSGVVAETTTDTGGGQNLGYLANGDWVRYSGIEFGSTGATQFKARVASGAASGISGLIEVRLDSRTATPVGSLAVAGTGGWQSWQTIPANISRITGTHDVYLTFTSGQPADFANLNWFTFSAT
ncbi:carbohydrate-binding protein [Streptomyces hoynatensis]|uniref:Carbohydrate-binding protein n=2 Tax=Streptomyces hoynatensis TaxID=1141874 RepID=A0A3A9ZCR1_9ACTN|nr:carbohydrate-binding protein [Streptomyces hoynatensis]